MPWFRRPVVFDAAGTAVAPPDPNARLLGMVADGLSTVREEGRTFRVFHAPVLLPSGADGTVQVARELDDLQEMWRQQTFLLLAFVPLAMVLGALGGNLLARRALAPVEAATRSAEAIRAENREQRLPVVGNDELARMAQTLNAMLDRLEEGLREREEALERQRRFTADASHELRTPLAQIKLRTSLALSGPADLDGDRAALEAADRAADTMARLIQQLLDLARSDGGALPVLEGDATHEVRAALSSFDDPRIVADLPDSPVRVWAPADGVGRVVTNLVSNALRHAPPDGHVWVRLQGAELTVEDDGPGVAEEALAHLGERFFRVDDARARASGGTGLGLAIVRALVASGGGTLSFAHREGGGLSIRVGFRRPE